MLCTQIVFGFGKHSEQFMYTTELGIFMYWTGDSMDNLLSYCGLVDAKIRASVLSLFFCEKFIPQYIILLQCRGIKKTAPSELIWLILISVHLFFLRPKKHDEKKQLTPFERKLLMLVISSCDMQCMPPQTRRNSSKFGGDIPIWWAKSAPWFE